jgi:hypothetical protein
MGFLVGFHIYAAVALCATSDPGVKFMFPLAETLADTHGCVQWVLVVLLGGLISISVILVNHMIELIHFSKTWFVFEIERHQIAVKLFERDFSQKTRKRDSVSAKQSEASEHGK